MQYIRFLRVDKIIFLFLLFFYHTTFAQNTGLATDTLANLSQNLNLASINLAKNNYLQVQNSTKLAIENLTLLAELFKPLLEKLKQLKKDSQESLKDILEQQQPQQTENILQNTKKALQESSKAGQKNAKVTNYIEQAKQFQESKSEALANQDWERSQDLENRNINALQKAIKELEKQNGKNKNDSKQTKENSLKSQEAAAKLSQIKRNQENTKQDRQRIYGKRINEKRRVPVNKDW